VESASYGPPTRKIRRLQVYAGKRVENKAAKGKMGGSRFLRGNLGLLRRKPVEGKGSGQKWHPGALPRA
jgi:hypothetical protein